MAMNQKLWGRVETVPFTASADRAAGDLVHEGNWYGIVVNTTANGADGMLHVRGAFECTKESAAEVIAGGDYIEFVAGGKIQKHDQGVKIAKAYEGSGNGIALAIIALMPELY